MAVATETAFDARSLGVSYRFWIVGITPLLTHNPATMRVTEHQIKRKGSRAEIPPPDVEAAAGCYRLPTGEFGLPAVAFREALLRAAREYPVPSRKRGRVVPVLSVFLGHVIALPELTVLRDPDSGLPVTAYEIDIRRVVVQRQGVLRARPKFWPWACEVEFIANPELIAQEKTAEILETVLTDAGGRIGVGDYRPGQGGPFGRFRVELRSEGG
jgi:hypothetical protein